MAEENCCHHKKGASWYRQPLFIVAATTVFLFLFNFVLSKQGIFFLNLPTQKFLEYLSKTWLAIIIGLFIGGLVEVFAPPSLMAKWLGRSKRSVLTAVLLGFLASACSHGILAIAVSLHKKGASTASTLAFLLAAPWANLAVTMLLFSLFGIKALLIVGGALLIAVAAGFIFRFLEERKIIEGQREVLKEELSAQTLKFKWSEWRVALKKVFSSAWELAKMVIWWVLLGFLISSILGSFLPEEIFHRYFGINLLGMLATLLIATVIEICSEGSAPMAFELFEKTGAFGNAFIFLQAGVVTDYTEIGIIWRNIGRRAAIALAAVTVPMVLLLGFLFNRLTF